MNCHDRKRCGKENGMTTIEPESKVTPEPAIAQTKGQRKPAKQAKSAKKAPRAKEGAANRKRTERTRRPR
jgi:hypothetical protein